MSMPLKRTPPNSPMPSTADEQDSHEKAKSLNLQQSTQRQNYDSAPDLPSLANIAERKKRKHDGSTDEAFSITSVLKEMFSTFSKDQDKRFNELQQTIGGIKEQNDALTNSVDLMSQKYDEFITRIAQLEAERKEDKKLIHILEEKIEYLEKKNRTTGIEIRNIPKATGETKQDLCKLVQKLGNTLKIDIKYSDVKDIYRINTKDGTNPIVAELTTVLLKENIIKEVKSFNKNKNKGEKLNTTHFNSHQPMKPVFVSETLTSKTQRLFHLAREFQKNYRYAFCWTSHGTIYLRKEEKAPAIKIASDIDLQDLRKAE